VGPTRLDNEVRDLRFASDTLKPGDRAPGFTLPTQRGEPRALDDLLKRGPLLLAFHRGTW
jgi:peroxiredoxin